MTTPCIACPFHDGQHGPVLLERLAADRIPCHMTCRKQDDEDGFPEYVRTAGTVPCVGVTEWLNAKKGDQSCPRTTP